MMVPVGNYVGDRPVTDEERDRALQVLRRAGGDLGLDELEKRLDAAIAARTVGQLAAVVWDLNRATPPPTREVNVWRNVGFRLHAVAYGLTNGFLLGTWAVTGPDFFWPFFPAAGWGIALGLHGAAVHLVQQRRWPRRREPIEAAPPIRPIVSAEGSIGQGVLPPSRNLVVVMFTDVVDSTRLTEVIGDAEWSRVRARHLTVLRACYDANRGKEISAQGDGFMAQFTSPVDAVQCAVEIQRRLQSQREESGFALPVRIGMHAGEAMVETDDLLGRVINLAARVMAEAAPGEVFVTESLADQLDARFQLEDRGLRTLKGVARPRHLLAVHWGA